jgi:hypothetical protein
LSVVDKSDNTLEVIMCDTSYSGTAPRNAHKRSGGGGGGGGKRPPRSTRGDALSALVIDVDTSAAVAATQARVTGVLDNGTRIAYALPPLSLSKPPLHTSMPLSPESSSSSSSSSSPSSSSPSSLSAMPFTVGDEFIGARVRYVANARMHSVDAPDDDVAFEVDVATVVDGSDVGDATWLVCARASGTSGDSGDVDSSRTPPYLLCRTAGRSIYHAWVSARKVAALLRAASGDNDGDGDGDARVKAKAACSDAEAAAAEACWDVVFGSSPPDDASSDVESDKETEAQAASATSSQAVH